MFARFFGAAQSSILIIDQNKIEDLATMAYCAYKDDYTGWDIPEGWAGWTDFESESYEIDHGKGSSYGYEGKAFVRYGGNDGDPRVISEIVIVHRGSILSNFSNILGDLQYAIDKIPLQIIPANYFIKRVLTEVKRDYDHDELDISKLVIWHVGHSLGAVIANCMFVNPDNYGMNRCVTFENPGVKNLVLNYMISYLKMSQSAAQDRSNQLESNILIYQSDINAINTFNDQWGKVNYVKIPYRFTFPDHPSLPIASDNIGKNYFLNIYYLLTYSFYDQHNMANFVYHLKKGVPIIDANDRKSGLANGYLQYLDGEKRKEYWLQYFNIVWVSNDEIQRVFHHKYSAFEIFMFGLLDDDRKLALVNEDNKVKEIDIKLKMNTVFSRAEAEPNDYVIVEAPKKYAIR